VQDPFSIHNSTEDSLIHVTCQSLSFKVLGGSSCTNVCLHHRGSAEDYNEWNVPGWSAAEVLPVFKATQKDMTDRSPEFHGKDGEWVMEEVRYQNPLSKRFLEVGAAAGLGTNDDFNNWSRPQDGVGRFQVSEVNGERCSGAQAFLHKALKRKNLKVRTGTMVRKIDFDESKTAVGVSYDLLGDDTCKVSCLSKEVFRCSLFVLDHLIFPFL
jgi:choline dehydrogenase-like flavoprotein